MTNEDFIFNQIEHQSIAEANQSETLVDVGFTMLQAFNEFPALIHYAKLLEAGVEPRVCASRLMSIAFEAGRAIGQYEALEAEHNKPEVTQ